MSDNYRIVSGLIFGAIALLQAVRAFNQWPVHVSTFDVPVWASWIATAVAGSLCLWAFRSESQIK